MKAEEVWWPDAKFTTGLVECYVKYTRRENYPYSSAQSTALCYPLWREVAFPEGNEPLLASGRGTLGQPPFTREGWVWC